MHHTSGTSVGVLWHLSGAATIDAEEARLYSNGELNGVGSSNTFLDSVLIYLQGDLTDLCFIDQVVVSTTIFFFRLWGL